MERDFRVRAFLYIKNEGTAIGLYDHVQDIYDEAVDITPNSPTAEMRLLEIGDDWIVLYDLAFPPDRQGMAIGLFNHTKNILTEQACPMRNPCFVSLERCGHRIAQACEIVERYEVA